MIDFLRRVPFTTRRARRRALESARLIDDVVAAQLPLVARLPEDRRRGAADHLAELVLLAQSYRHHAHGWIGKRELDARARATGARLATLRAARPVHVHLTEQD